MKKYLLSLVLCAFIANSFAAAATKTQKLCPILKGEISKSVYTDYKGKRIYFCCGGCIEEFKKDPEKYVKNMEKEGIKLEDTPKTGK